MLSYISILNRNHVTLFNEPFNRKQLHRGSIEVICGSMFSGKTEELIRRLRRAEIAKLHVEIFKPAIDTRYDENAIVSHDLNSIQSTPVNSAESILLLSNNVQVVGIDEAQFFDDNLPMVCLKLAAKGMRVIVAGLDMDYLGQPFGPMPALMAIAEYVTKVQAVCLQCGNPASHSFRKIENDAQVMLGEKESYEPRCRMCYNLGK
jgi:thymidine kinase